MSVLIKLILTLSCSLNFTSVSTKSVQVTPSTQQISSHPTSQQSRSTYEVLVSIEEKLSFFNTVATPVYLNEDQQYYTFNQIGRRIDVVDARLSHIEENLELKMHKILEVITSVKIYINNIKRDNLTQLEVCRLSVPKMLRVNNLSN